MSKLNTIKERGMSEEKLRVRRRIKLLGYKGEKLELLIERYGSHDNVSVWHKGKELYGMHFTADFISVFPADPNAMQYIRISSANKQIQSGR